MSIPPHRRDGPSAATRFGPETLFRIAWQRKWHVALGLFLGVVVSAGIGFQLPRVYQSSAQISIIKKRPDAVTGIDTRPLSGDEAVSPAQDILKSSLIIERAVQSKGLAALALNAREDADLTDTIKQSLIVLPGRGPTGQTSVYKLSFRAGSADDSRV